MEQFTELKKEILKRLDENNNEYEHGNLFNATTQKEFFDLFKPNFIFFCRNKIIDANLIEKYKYVFNSEKIYLNVYFGYGYLFASDNSKVTAYDNSVVFACDNSKVFASDNSKVTAYDNSVVFACDNSEVFASDNSKVSAYDNSVVFACDNSEVFAYDNSKVFASGNSKVIARKNLEVNYLK
jgi:hypothetical protein